MNFLNYSIISIISYSGLFLGFLLAIIAKEEIKQGERYFILLKKTILALIFIFLLILKTKDHLTTTLILAFVILYMIKTKKEFNELPYIYIILGLVLYTSSKNLELLMIESSLIFILGFPVGTLLTKKDKKRTLKEIIKNIGLVISAIIPFFFKTIS